MSCGNAGCTDATACNYNATATIDDGSCTYASLPYFSDLDGDGFGSGSSDLYCVDPGTGYSTYDTDCDDTNAAINPNGIEVCNGNDENCNGESDEFVTTTFYVDADGDGFGDVNVAVQDCSAPAGYVTNFDACDDAVVTYLDMDGDGEGSATTDGCGVLNDLS